VRIFDRSADLTVLSEPAKRPSLVSHTPPPKVPDPPTPLPSQWLRGMPLRGTRRATARAAVCRRRSSTRTPARPTAPARCWARCVGAVAHGRRTRPLALAAAQPAQPATPRPAADRERCLLLQGGFATAYQCSCLNSGTEKAVKVVARSSIRDSKSKQKVSAAPATARLNTPRWGRTGG
jgi:hypothetical protein